MPLNLFDEIIRLQVIDLEVIQLGREVFFQSERRGFGDARHRRRRQTGNGRPAKDALQHCTTIDCIHKASPFATAYCPQLPNSRPGY
jgi:hypothetical protein